MAKSKIIKDLVESKITLEEGLQRLQLLAHCVGNVSLENWAIKEVEGYEKQDNLPEYRIVETVEFRYSGFNGMCQVTNNSLPGYLIEKEHLEKVRYVKLVAGIKYISEISSGTDGLLRRDITYLCSDVSKLTNNQIQCASIFQIIGKEHYANVVSKVKGMLLDALLSLEDKYGVLDSMDISLTGIKTEEIVKTNIVINNRLFGSDGVTRNIERKWYETYWWSYIFPILLGIFLAELVRYFTGNLLR